MGHRATSRLAWTAVTLMGLAAVERRAAADIASALAIPSDPAPSTGPRIEDDVPTPPADWPARMEAAPQEPADAPSDAAGEPTTPAPRRKWGPELSLMVMPSLSAHPEKNHGKLRKAGVETGWGAGALFSFNRPDRGDPNITFGILYLVSMHDADKAGTTARIHQVYAEVMGNWKLSDTPSPWFAHAALGVGGLVVDFGGNVDDTGGAAMEGRLLVGMQASRTVEIRAGGGAYLWGYPTNFAGYGTFPMAEVVILF